MKSDRFAVLGQLAAGVAHEVNNPLNGILTYIKLVSKKLKQKHFQTAELLKYLSIMERETINIGRIVKNLLDFSRRTEPEIIPHVGLPALILKVQGGPLGPLPGAAHPEQDLVASDARMPGLGPAQT